MSTDNDHFDDEAYAYLRQLAARVHAERGGRNDSMRPTELLHEAWAKLAKGEGNYASRTHFLATAARSMRFIMVDRARARSRLKRGDPRLRTTLTGLAEQAGSSVDILDLDEALKALAEVDAVSEQVVTMRVFGGLTIEEVAENLGVSPRTVNKRWRYARVWLAERLKEDGDGA